LSRGVAQGNDDHSDRTGLATHDSHAPAASRPLPITGLGTTPPVDGALLYRSDGAFADESSPGSGQRAGACADPAGRGDTEGGGRGEAARCVDVHSAQAVVGVETPWIRCAGPGARLSAGAFVER